MGASEKGGPGFARRELQRVAKDLGRVPMASALNDDDRDNRHRLVLRLVELLAEAEAEEGYTWTTSSDTLAG